jgi:hypothetical protein
MRTVAVARVLRSLACLAACGLLGGIAAAADTVRDARPVAEFKRIELTGPADLILTHAARHTLVIEAEPRLLPRIRARVEGGTLRFDYGPEPLVSRAPIRFHVEAPVVERITALGSGDLRAAELQVRTFTLVTAGSGDAELSGLRAERVEVESTGSGDLRLAGRVASQRISLLGSGSYLASGLESRQASIRLAGSGDAELRVREQLEARLTGSGDIRVLGRPEVRSEIVGAGELTLVEGGGD